MEQFHCFLFLLGLESVSSTRLPTQDAPSSQLLQPDPSSEVSEQEPSVECALRVTCEQTLPLHSLDYNYTQDYTLCDI